MAESPMDADDIRPSGLDRPQATYGHRPAVERAQRCSYCGVSAGFAVHDGRGRTTYACSEHLHGGVGKLLTPPQVINMDTHEVVLVDVIWTVLQTGQADG